MCLILCSVPKLQPKLCFNARVHNFSGKKLVCQKDQKEKPGINHKPGFSLDIEIILFTPCLTSGVFSFVLASSFSSIISSPNEFIMERNAGIFFKI